MGSGAIGRDIKNYYRHTAINLSRVSLHKSHNDTVHYTRPLKLVLILDSIFTLHSFFFYKNPTYKNFQVNPLQLIIPLSSQVELATQKKMVLIKKNAHSWLLISWALLTSFPPGSNVSFSKPWSIIICEIVVPLGTC